MSARDNGDIRRWNALPLDPSQIGTINLQNAGLIDRDGTIVAHGWIDAASMALLRVDDYQREILGVRGILGGRNLHQAVLHGAMLPDVVLGMRGEHISFPKGSNDCTLMDPVYIIDGLQRIAACRRAADSDENIAKTIRLGAEVRFSTTKNSERELFNILNTRRTPVSPNVILRNMREDCPAILTLYGLCHADKNFAMYERVCWNQRMSRNELISATTMANTICSLYGIRSISKIDSIGRFLTDIANRHGLSKLRRNITVFYDVVDFCWGIRTIQYAEKASHLRNNFSTTLARVFHDHQNFWSKDDLLEVDRTTARKLASFPVLDPEVARLAGAGTMAGPILYGLIVDHMNKGMKRNRLVKRHENSNGTSDQS